MRPAIRSRGYLPHWECGHAIYFVTFRLADSLPQELLARLREERAALDRAIPPRSAGVSPASFSPPYTAADEKRAQKLNAILKKAEQCLDEGRGACHLQDPRVAKVVSDALHHFNEGRYRLYAWCIMPNHVHVLFSPIGESTLETILHAWKSYSAKKINKLLGQTGHFWQREYFDHLVRHESSLQKITEYIGQNPQKAGLKNWPWLEVLR